MTAGRISWGMVWLGCLVGCGATAPDGPLRFQVHGKVSLDGEPLASGFIQFEPDASAKNSGPGTSCPIVNGHYKTETGAIAGAMIIRISPPAAVSGSTGPIVNFTVQELKREFPAADSEQDFEVTKQRKK